MYDRVIFVGWGDFTWCLKCFRMFDCMTQVADTHVWYNVHMVLQVSMAGTNHRHSYIESHSLTQDNFDYRLIRACSIKSKFSYYLTKSLSLPSIKSGGNSQSSLVVQSKSISVTFSVCWSEIKKAQQK